MSTELFGLIYLGIGIILLVWGARLAQLVLALWGLGIGLWIGELVTRDQGLTYAWIFFIVWGIGLLAMVLAYSYYKITLSLLTGSAAFWIGAAILSLWNLDPSLQFSLAVAASIVAFLVTLRSELPDLILVIISSIIGASYTLCGVLILLNGANVREIGYGPLNLVLRQDTWWIVVFLVLAAVSMSVQIGPRRSKVSDGI